MPFFRNLICSRIGWLLVTVQLCLILYWFGQGSLEPNAANLTAEDIYSGRFIGGRFVELDSTLSWTLVLINVLPLVVAQGLIKLLFLLSPSLQVTTLSWVQAVQLLALSSLQWLMVGHFIERMIRLARWRS